MILGIVAACAPAHREEIVVSAASSLRDAIDAAARAYREDRPGVDIRVNAGGSNLLARQIAEGAPVDVFVSADERTIAALASRGWIIPGSMAAIASNRVVIARAKDRPIEVRSIEDLAADRVRSIALPDTAVPIGRYGGALLAGAGLLPRLEGRIVRTENDAASVAALRAGAVDLAVIYASDVRPAPAASGGGMEDPGIEIALEPPPGSVPPVRIVAGLVRRDGAGGDARGAAGAHGRAAAEFLRFLRGPNGRRILGDAGFLPADDGR